MNKASALTALAALALAAAFAARRSSPRGVGAPAPAGPPAESEALERRALLNLDALTADPAAKAFADSLAAEPGLRAALAAGPDAAQEARFRELVARHAADPGFRSAVENPRPGKAGADCAPPPPKPALAPAAGPEPGCAGEDAAAPQLFPGQNAASPTP